MKSIRMIIKHKHIMKQELNSACGEVGELMEKKKEKQAEPLYYIEQPAFSNIGGNSQTLSVRKKIGSKTEQKSDKKEKKMKQKAKQKKGQQDPMETNEEHQEEVKNEIEEIEHEQREESNQKTNKSVQEMLDYIAKLPHFIQPVVACETKEKHIQGKLLYAEDGEVVMQDRRNFSRITIQDKDITDMYIVSL